MPASYAAIAAYADTSRRFSYYYFSLMLLLPLICFVVMNTNNHLIPSNIFYRDIFASRHADAAALLFAADAALMRYYAYCCFRRAMPRTYDSHCHYFSLLTSFADIMPLLLHACTLLRHFFAAALIFFSFDATDIISFSPPR